VQTVTQTFRLTLNESECDLTTRVFFFSAACIHADLRIGEIEFHSREDAQRFCRIAAALITEGDTDEADASRLVARITVAITRGMAAGAVAR
jgi:hypothetical protein